MAMSLSLKEEMQNIDIVISSNYVRAISTAKYIAYQNNKDVNIVEESNERKFGIDKWEEKPKNFDLKQIENQNYKMPKGESRMETAERMYKALLDVLDKYEGKRIAIVSHATAITYLFMKMFKSDGHSIKFNNKLLMDENFVWDAPEVFKLIYEEDNLISIENIK